MKGVRLLGALALLLASYGNAASTSFPRRLFTWGQDASPEVSGDEGVGAPAGSVGASTPDPQNFHRYLNMSRVDFDLELNELRNYYRGGQLKLETARRVAERQLVRLNHALRFRAANAALRRASRGVADFSRSGGIEKVLLFFCVFKLLRLAEEVGYERFRAATEEEAVEAAEELRRQGLLSPGSAGSADGKGGKRVEDLQLDKEEQRLLTACLVDTKSLKTQFDEIGGLESAKDALMELVVYPMQHPEVFRGHRLLRPPSGLLLYGPPGCGKTMLARATAREAGAHLLELAPSALQSKWHGDTPKAAAALFSLARKLAPCIIYIDEVDAVCRRRDAREDQVSRDLKAELLQRWDGLRDNNEEGVIIIGATNAPQDLDPAFQRRFGRSVLVPRPGREARAEVLRVESENRIDFALSDELAAIRAEQTVVSEDLLTPAGALAAASTWHSHSHAVEFDDGIQVHSDGNS